MPVASEVIVADQIVGDGQAGREKIGSELLVGDLSMVADVAGRSEVRHGGS